MIKLMYNDNGEYMNNIFEKKYISFHGIGDFNFIKLKSILTKGILPNHMLPNVKPRNSLLGNNDTKVYLVKSPILVGQKNARGYRSYIEKSIGIVVNRFPMEPNSSIQSSFPDAGYLEGPLPPSSFIGITIPQEIYDLALSDLPQNKVIVDNNIQQNITVEELINLYNINKLPVYDCKTGALLNISKINNDEIKKYR